MNYIVLLFLTASLLYCDATSKELFKLTRLQNAIQLDGILDDTEWQGVAPLPLVMYQPTYQGDMTERTDIRVAYDDNFVYLAGHLYSEKLNEVRGNSLYRDSYSGDDIVAIVLDTYNDNDNVLWFFTNPLGTRLDANVSNDAANGRGSMNFNWNAYWDAATSLAVDGWTAEPRFHSRVCAFRTTTAT